MSHEYRRFTMTDTLARTPGQRIPTDYVENTISVGGQLIKEQGQTLHYNVMGEIALVGEDAGQFQIQGKGDLNFRLFSDTVRLEANAYIKNLNPIFTTDISTPNITGGIITICLKSCVPESKES